MDINKKKAEKLKNSLKAPCKDCQNKEADIKAQMPDIMQSIMAKIGSLLPGGCNHDAPMDAPIMGRSVLMIIKKPDSDKVDDKTGKKILEKNDVTEAKQHKTNKFIQRCVASITGGDPESKEKLSRSFAICKAQEYKSKAEGKHPVKSAAKRAGYRADKAKFVAALKAVKGK